MVPVYRTKLQPLLVMLKCDLSRRSDMRRRIDGNSFCFFYAFSTELHHVTTTLLSGRRPSGDGRQQQKADRMIQSTRSSPRRTETLPIMPNRACPDKGLGPSRVALSCVPFRGAAKTCGRESASFRPCVEREQDAHRDDPGCHCLCLKP